MLIDTATLQQQLDAITEQYKVMNALSRGDPATNWGDLLKAQQTLHHLYARLGQAVFKAYIDAQHAEKMAQIADLISGATSESVGGG
jgi:hypothetical protein